MRVVMANKQNHGVWKEQNDIVSKKESSIIMVWWLLWNRHNIINARIASIRYR